MPSPTEGANTAGSRRARENQVCGPALKPPRRQIGCAGPAPRVRLFYECCRGAFIGHTYANWNYGVSLFYCMSEVLTEHGPGYSAAIKGSEIKMLGEKAGFKKIRRLPVENPFNALYEFKTG